MSIIPQLAIVTSLMSTLCQKIINCVIIIRKTGILKKDTSKTKLVLTDNITGISFKS